MKVLPLLTPWDQPRNVHWILPGGNITFGTLWNLGGLAGSSEKQEGFLSLPLWNFIFYIIKFIWLKCYVLPACKILPEVGCDCQGSSPPRSWGRHQQWKSFGFGIKKAVFWWLPSLRNFGSRTGGMLLSEHLPDPLCPCHNLSQVKGWWNSGVVCIPRFWFLLFHFIDFT